MSNGVLDGVRVLEVGLYIAAPLCGRILAAQGAEVIRIMTTKAQDGYWGAGPEPRGSIVPDLEAGKKHICLDLRMPEGRQILARLIAMSDMVVSNLTADALKRFGLDFPTLRGIKPDIIMVWQSGMGDAGPYRNLKAFGQSIVAMNGLAEATGFPGKEPMASGTAFCDFHSAVYSSFLLVAALERRLRTGKGLFIEVPLYEVGVNCMAVTNMDYLANGTIARRIGNAHPLASPHGAYPCSGEDRWCTIAVFSEHEWARFCEVIGQPAWCEDAKFATMDDRLLNRTELDQRIGEWTIGQDAYEVMATMQRAGVAAGVVFRGEDLVESRHLKERHFYQETMYPMYPFGDDAPLAGPSLALPVPINLSGTPCQFGPTHRIAEDNDYVYRELLCMTSIDIERLANEKVIV